MKTKTPLHRISTLFALALLATFGATHEAESQTLFVLSSSNYTQNFNSLGNSASTNVPTGWFATTNSTDFTATGGTNVTVAYGTAGTGAVTGTSGGGLVNWGSGTNASSTDRALGFLNTGSYTTGKSLVFGFTNSTGSSITNLSLAWDYEKYRSGTRAWTWTFAYSTNGSTWLTNSGGGLAYAADANNTTVFNPPTTTTNISLNIGSLSIGNGSSVYLRWTLDGTGGSSNGQGLAVDNFSLTASLQAALAYIWNSVSGNWDTGFGSTITNNQTIDRLTFATNATTAATNNLTGLTVTNMVISNTAGAFTVSGNAFNLTGGLTNNSANAQVFSNNINLSSAQTISNSAGSLRFDGNLTNAAGLTVGMVTNTTVQVNGVLAGASAQNLTKEGDGTLVLNNASSSVATLTANAGTVVLSNNLAATGLTGSGAINITNGTFTVTSAANQTYSGALSGGGTFAKAGSGTATLGGNSSFTGTLSVGAGGVVQSGTMAAATINVGGTLTAGSAGRFTGTPTVTVSNTGTLNLAGNETFGSLAGSGAVSNSTGTLTVGGSGASTTFDGVLSGAGALTKTGSGTFTLTSASNVYSGGTTINGGAVEITGANRLGNANGALTINDGKLLVTTAGLSSGRNIALGNANSTIEVASGITYTATNTSIVSGSGRLNKTGSGVLALYGTNTYSGGTVVSAGTLAGDTAGVRGAITNNATVNFVITTNGTYSGAMTGTGALTKSGAATLTTTGINDFSGATTISAGALLVNGTNANSAVTINSGATLGGNGSVGSVTVNGIIDPGTSPGTLAVTALTLNGGGAYRWEITDATAAAGTGWDVINVASGAGVITLNATSGSQFTINVIGTNPSNFLATTSRTWDIIDAGSWSAAFDASAFLINTNSFSATGNLGTWSVANNSGNLQLLYTAPVLASVYTWNAGSGLWSAGANWTNTLAPSNGSTVLFSGAGGASTNDNTVNSIASLTFSNTAGSYTISGGALTNGADGIVNNSANAQTINNDLTLGAAQTFNAAAGDLAFGGAISNGGNLLTIAGNSNTVISGAITGNGGLTKSGTGSLTLGGDNSYTGALSANGGTTLVNGTQAATTINVDGGTLLLGNNNRLADGATVALTTGTVNFGSFSDTITTFNQSGGTFTNGTLTATTYGLSGGTVGGTLGAGTANVTGDVTLSGVINSTLNINTGGTLTLAANDRIGNSSAVTVNAGTLATATFNDNVGSVVLTNSGSITGTGTITAGTYTLNGGTVSANLGTGTATSSAGTTTLNGTLAGDLAVSGGTLTLGGADRLANSSAVTVSSGTLNFGGFNDTVGSFSLSGGVFTNGTVTTTTYSLSGGTMGGTLGAGTANVTGGVTLSGVVNSTLNINTGGTLTLAAANRINDGSAVTVAGGTLNLGGFTDTVGSFSITGGAFNNGTLTAATYGLGGGTVGGNLGAGTINATGSTTLNGTAAATTVNVSGSTLTLGSAGRLAAGATVNVTNSGTLAIAGAESVTSLVLSNGTLGGAGQTLTAGSYALQGGTVTANLGAGTATASVGTTAINGNLGGALTASGGTANLNGTVAGNVTVSGGDVNLGSANRIADTATVAVSSGALNLGANNDSVRTVQITGGSITGSGVLTATSNYDVQGGTISAAIGGSAAMTKSGAATATISGNNSTYSGAVTVGSGALLAANNNAFGTAAITVTNGSTLAANGVSLANNFTIGGQGSVVTNATTNTFTAYWNFGTNAGNASATTTTGTGIAFGSISVTNNSGANIFLTNNSASSGYTGASGSYNAGANVLAGARSNSSTYFTFTLTADSGYQLSLTNLSFGARSTGSGPVLATVMSSLDSYAAALATNGLTANSSWSLITPTVTASALTNGAVTFRIYGSGGTGGSSSANWRIDDLNLFGYTVTNSLTTNAATGSGTLGISEAGTATFSGNIVNNTAATFTAASGGTATFSGIVSGEGTLNKIGAGTVTLSGASANTFTGTTTVSAGTLQLNKTADVTALSSTNLIVSKVDNDNRAVLLLSANNQVADTTAVTLSGGTITRGSGVSEVFGNLNLTEASFLDFGTGDTGNLAFGTYTSSALLTVQNFLPGNKLQFATGFDANLLPTGGNLSNANFSFSNGFTTGTEGGYFTITAIPEPSTYLAAAGLLGLMLWPSRKRIVRDAKKILGFTPPMRDRLARRAS